MISSSSTSDPSDGPSIKASGWGSWVVTYFHLAQNSVVVEIGSRIEADTMIARSGNTGFSSGPHLHFEVAKVARVPTSDKRIAGVSLPVQFDTDSGPVTCPADGTRIRKSN
ncbi:MAG: peptidoglycan DD-metalloendopeptidase family protein [Rhizobiaceae bacterium]|nr:peptidoglycan DD-metalloendopeptidase family protein [Rhizobiaceae bacterium]